MIQGEEVYQSLQTANKALAESRAKGIEAKMRDRQFDAIKSTQSRNMSPTVEEILEVYKEIAQARGLKHVTIREASSRLRKIVSRGIGDPKKVRLHQLNRNAVLKFVAASRLEEPNPEQLMKWKRTIKSTLRQARAVFAKWAVEEYKSRDLWIPDLDGFMTAEGVSAKGIAKRYERPPEHEVQAILDSVPEMQQKEPELYAVFLLVYACALRAGEAANARTEWIEKEDATWTLRIPVDSLYVPKGGRSRYVPLHPDVAKALIESGIRNGTGYLIAGNSPTARYNRVTKELAAWMRSHDWQRLKCAHELRALQGSRWYTEQGAEVAQLLLGHRSIETTCRYYANYTRRPEPLAPDWCVASRQ
jgi:integrase